MEKFSALLALCAGNSPVTGEFPAQRPVTQSFGVFFDLARTSYGASIASNLEIINRVITAPYYNENNTRECKLHSAKFSHKFLTPTDRPFHSPFAQP